MIKVNEDATTLLNLNHQSYLYNEYFMGCMNSQYYSVIKRIKYSRDYFIMIYIIAWSIPQAIGDTNGITGVT